MAREGSRGSIPVMSGVFEYLLGQGAPFLVLPASRARTAAEAAAVYDVDLRELVLTNLVIARSGPACMVIPGNRVLDVQLAQRALNDPEARMATHAEIRSFAGSIDLDALPPLPMWLMAPMYVDPAVASLDQLVFPAGRVSTLVCMQREDLFREQPYAVVALTLESYVPPPAIAPARRMVIRDEDLIPVHLLEEQQAAEGNEPRPADVA